MDSHYKQDHDTNDGWPAHNNGTPIPQLKQMSRSEAVIGAKAKELYDAAPPSSDLLEDAKRSDARTQAMKNYIKK